jgi:hypothetical protein
MVSTPKFIMNLLAYNLINCTWCFALLIDFDGDVHLKKGTPSSKATSETGCSEGGVSVKGEGQMYGNYRVANAEEGHVTLSQSHFDDLHAALQRMQLVVDEASATMQQYKKDMESMRKVIKFFFNNFRPAV